MALDEAATLKGGLDPQIHLGGVPRIPHVAHGAALFEAEFDVVGEPLVNPVLYFDVGAGFNQSDVIQLQWDGTNRLVGQLAEISRLRGLRFDPSELPCVLKLHHMRIRQARGPQIPAQLDGRPIAAGSPAPAHARFRSTGVRVLETVGLMAMAEPDLFEFTDEDPQVIFVPLPEGHAGSLVAEVEFHVEAIGGLLTSPRIYLDYGAGFSHAESFLLKEQPDGRYRALIALPALVRRVRWDPSNSKGRMCLHGLRAAPLSFAALAAGETSAFKPSRSLPLEEQEMLQPFGAQLSLRLNAEYVNSGALTGEDYGRWVERYEGVESGDASGMLSLLSGLKRRPKFSFVTPTYNTPPALLEACVRSMLDQVYPDFEICIADDNSTDPEVRKTLRRLAALDERIKVKFRRRNGHISEASNSALDLADGDYVVLVDHDDLVPNYCLLMVAAYLDRHPQAKVLYSDEDKIDLEGRRCDPYFKSDFNEFLMYGHNMVSHLGVYDRSLIKAIGGFRKGYEGSQDYDLFLRCLARCGADQVVHIPHVLYHWRMLPGSTAVSADQKSYAVVAAQKSLNDYFQTQGLPFASVDGVAPGLTGVEIVGEPPTIPVSVIIPTRDGLDLLTACIESLRSRLDEAVEILIVDNGSVEPATLAYLAQLTTDRRFRVIPAPGPFNFSSLCNLGVAEAAGDIICLLNNDTELLSDDWLRRARTLLGVRGVGIVGARLAYPDLTLQHFGLYLGMGAHGVAGTPHRGERLEAFGSFGKARLIQEFSAVTAACLFVRREVYQAVGGFDLDLRVAYNDVDFCLKVRKQGLKVVCDPGMLLIHKESKTRGSDAQGQRAARLEEEAALMRRRWGAVLAQDPYYSPNLTLERDDLSIAAAPRNPLPWKKSKMPS